MEPVRLSDAAFDLVAAGRCTAKVAELLNRAQHSRGLLLLSHVLREARLKGDWGEAAVRVISEAQACAGPAANRVLSDAWMGVWSSRLAESTAPVLDTGYLVGAAAAVAWHVSFDASLSASFPDGVAHIPTLGSVTVGESPARVSVRDRNLSVSTADATVAMDGPGWTGVRRLPAEHAGQRLDLVVDDLSPLRDCFGKAPAQRLNDEDYSRWCECYHDAWGLLVRESPAEAHLLTQWVRTVVPLNTGVDGAALSATSYDVPGAVALSEPADAGGFAASLIHERAHTMLNGLITVRPLARPDATATYFAPWRRDSRPAIALLHGAYAFLAVAHWWQSIVDAPRYGETARRQLATLGAQLPPAISALTSSTDLTPDGHRLVAILEPQVRELSRTRLPTELVEAAAGELKRRREDWLARRS